MISIKSWVNKDFLIEFILKPEKVKFQVDKMSSFLQGTSH